jgi:hypothetical protein
MLNHKCLQKPRFSYFKYKHFFEHFRSEHFYNFNVFKNNQIQTFSKIFFKTGKIKQEIRKTNKKGKHKRKMKNKEKKVGKNRLTRRPNTASAVCSRCRLGWPIEFALGGWTSIHRTENMREQFAHKKELVLNIFFNSQRDYEAMSEAADTALVTPVTRIRRRLVSPPIGPVLTPAAGSPGLGSRFLPSARHPTMTRSR